MHFWRFDGRTYLQTQLAKLMTFYAGLLGQLKSCFCQVAMVMKVQSRYPSVMNSKWTPENGAQ